MMMMMMMMTVVVTVYMAVYNVVRVMAKAKFESQYFQNHVTDFDEIMQTSLRHRLLQHLNIFVRIG